MRFPDPITHFKSHLCQDSLERMRTTALSASGFSAGLIIVFSQASGHLAYSAVSLWASLVSLIIWLFGAQYVSAYLVHGEHSYSHINVFIAALVSLLGYVSLFVAVVATVWRLSSCAGVLLMVLGIVLAVAVFLHFQSVSRHCNDSGA